MSADQADETTLAKAYGLADRAHGIANSTDTQFVIASGTKGFTALTIMSLVESGALELSTTARRVLGDDLRSIDDAVTVGTCSRTDRASATTSMTD